MKTSTKFTIITIVIAVITFGLSRIIWPDVEGAVAPTGGQLPLFIFLSALESLAFGVGVAFFTLGFKHMKELLPERKSSALAFFAIVWLLVSWWPHDNMHRVNGHDNLAGLLKIEYIFHFTLILAGLILAYNFWKFISRPKMP